MDTRLFINAVQAIGNLLAALICATLSGHTHNPIVGLIFDGTAIIFFAVGYITIACSLDKEHP